VQNHFASAAPQSIDVAAVDQQDLAAISSVAQRLNAPEPAPSQSLLLRVVEEPATVETGPRLPEIPANASPVNVAILERVKLRGEEWVIEIQEGDSLFQISEALYGDRQKFLNIYEANADALRDPGLILVGQVLVLPKS
jgi:nucleoid-associated protein YgaU